MQEAFGLSCRGFTRACCKEATECTPRGSGSGSPTRRCMPQPRGGRTVSPLGNSGAARAGGLVCGLRRPPRLLGWTGQTQLEVTTRSSAAGPCRLHCATQTSAETEPAASVGSVGAGGGEPVSLLQHRAQLPDSGQQRPTSVLTRSPPARTTTRVIAEPVGYTSAEWAGDASRCNCQAQAEFDHGAEQ